MPRIEFIEDAEYDVANEDGTRSTVRIRKGEVRDVTEASAARWERRNKAKRMLSAIERAANVLPASPGVEANNPVHVVAPPPPPPSADAGAVEPLAPPPPPPPADPDPAPVRRGPGRPRSTPAGSAE